MKSHLKAHSKVEDQYFYVNEALGTTYGVVKENNFTFGCIN
jgi:hypothetical protein